MHLLCLQVLCVWDVPNQRCERRLTGVFPKMQENTHTLLFLHEERQLTLLSFNSLLLLLETMEEEKRISSHEHPATCVLYNSLFRQVCRWMGFAIVFRLFHWVALSSPETNKNRQWRYWSPAH